MTLGQDLVKNAEKTPRTVKRFLIILTLTLSGCGDSALDSPFRGWGKLLRAIKADDTEAVRILLDSGMDPNITSDFGWAALHSTVFFERKEIADLLIERGANVNAKTFAGAMPIVFSRSDDVVSLLLSNGAAANFVDTNGKTLLDCAETHKNEAMIDILRKHGGKTSKELAENQPLNQRLLDAIERNDVPAARQALDDGADPNYLPDPSGRDLRPVLARAILQKRTEVACLLIERGANVHARCGGGMTPLHYAAKWGNVQIAGLLLANGADVNAASRRGRPLDMAKQRGQKDVAALLLKHGARSTQVHGKTTMVVFPIALICVVGAIVLVCWKWHRRRMASASVDRGE